MSCGCSNCQQFFHISDGSPAYYRTHDLVRFVACSSADKVCPHDPPQCVMPCAAVAPVDRYCLAPIGAFASDLRLRTTQQARDDLTLMHVG